MGQELPCALEYRGRKSSGKAYLESDHIRFRGATRVDILIKQIKGVECDRGDLILQLPEGTAVLSLGAHAAKWARKLLNPPSLLDKLGLKEGQKVAVSDAPGGEAFVEQIAARTKIPVQRRLSAGLDIIIAGFDKAADLNKLERYYRYLTKDGAIWAVIPKGSREMPSSALFEVGRHVGLTDNKVAKFSDIHTAYRFVIPRAARK